MDKKAAVLVIAFIIGVLLLRTALAGICLPEGTLLEKFAQSVRNEEITVPEAVTAFCQEFFRAAS